MPWNDSNAPFGAADTPRSLSKIKVARHLLLTRSADCCGE